MCVCYPLPRRVSPNPLLLRLFLRAALALALIRMRLHGAERLPPASARAFFVWNRQSPVDLFAVVAALPYAVHFIVPAAALSIHVLGWILSLSRVAITLPPQSLLRMLIDVIPEMRRRRCRLFLVEYEGTLVEPVALPDLSFPSSSLLHFLQQLSCELENFVCIVSGWSRQTLENWFGNINVGLICEHGCDYVHPGGDEWHTVVEASNESWKASVIPILQHYKQRSPGAHLEIKEKTIAWHFRDAAPLFGSWQDKELQLLLAESCMNLPVEVISGPQYLELRLETVSWVSALQRILSEYPDGCDFVFAIGSDKADEQVISFLTDLRHRMDGLIFTLTCRVGGKSDSSAADRYVPDSDVVFRVLKELIPPSASSTLAFPFSRVRIVRITTHPDLYKMGYGSRVI